MEQLSLLHALTADNVHGKGSLAEKRRIRRRQLELSQELVRFLLSMASEQCGGRSVFRLFFKKLREVLEIESRRRELREELADSLRVVESDFLEERRRFEARKLAFERRKEEAEQERARQIARRSERVQIIISIAGSLFLPFSVVSGIWGMNNVSTPINASWGWVLGGTGIVCGFLFVLIGIYFYVTRPRFNDTISSEIQVDEEEDEQLEEDIREWQLERADKSRFF